MVNPLELLGVNQNNAPEPLEHPNTPLGILVHRPEERVKAKVEPQVPAVLRKLLSRRDG